jgi:hypothetical protein
MGVFVNGSSRDFYATGTVTIADIAGEELGKRKKGGRVKTEPPNSQAIEGC